MGNNPLVSNQPDREGLRSKCVPAASMPSLSDAVGEAMLRLQLERGQIGVVIYTDAAVEATRVDLVVTRGS